MAIRDEYLNLNIVVNSNKAQAEIAELTTKTQALRQQKRLMREQNQQNTAEYRKLNQQIRENEERLTGLRKEVGLTAMSFRDLGAEQRRLRAAMAGLSPQTREWRQYSQQLQRVNGRLTELRGGASRVNGTFGRMSASLSNVQARGIGIIAVITGIAMSVWKLVDANSELSDSLVDVAKTTDLTNEQVIDLYESLQKIDTRTSNKRLLELAETAGRLGIKGSANIRNFVEEADKIEVALGDVLGETAIKDVGKLANLFDASMTQIGNTINKLGASSQAQEGFIIDFMKRTAGAAANAEIELSNLAGIGSTLDALGQTVETSGTAISKTIVDMFSNTAAYADVAGMSLSEFTTLLNEDTNEAFIRTVEGLKGNNEGMSIMVERLNSLDIDGSRAVSVLGALADNTELLREQQKIANEEFRSGNSMLIEFNKKNENLAASIEKITKRFQSLFVSGPIMNGLKSIVGYIDELTETKLSETLYEEKIHFNALIESIKNANTPIEIRRDLIQQVNDKYSDYLPNLINEKTYLEDIETAQKGANDEFERRIRLQASEELLADKMKDISSIAKDYYESIIELGRIEAKEGEMNMDAFLVSPFNSQKQRYQKLRDEAKIELDSLKKEYADISEILKIDELRAEDNNNTENEPVDYEKGGTSTVVPKNIVDARIATLARLEQLQFDYEQSLRNSLDRQLEDIDRKYNSEIEAAAGNSDIIAALNVLRNNEQADAVEAFNAEQYEKRKEEEIKFQEEKASIRSQYQLASAEELRDQELVALEEYYAQNIISFEEYKILENEINERYNEIQKENNQSIQDEKLKSWQETASKAAAISQAFSTFVSTLQEYELSKAGDNEEEKLKIKKKYADIQFAADAASIVSGTAVAIIQAFAQLGPIGGPIATSFIGATGALQLGIANVERQKVKQLARGKYNVFGEDDGLSYNAGYESSLSTQLVKRPTLVGEEPEIVIDTATTANILLNEPDLVPRILSHKQGSRQSVPQRADGNLNIAQANNELDSQFADIIRSNAQALNALTKTIQNGITARTYLYGDGGIKDAEQVDDDIKRDTNA